MRLASQRYGKERVRVLRVARGSDGVHAVHEIEAGVSLEGEGFADTYLIGDNAKVVPTDTVKNTVQALAARERLDVVAPERFALALGRHFLARYAQVERVRVHLAVRPWNRYVPAAGAGKDGDDGGHPHTFLGRVSGAPFTRVELHRGGQDDVPRVTTVESGVRDLLILKSTASAFAGFSKCEFTTLPETGDRILATKLEATWTFAAPRDDDDEKATDFPAVNAAIPRALLDTFAQEFSPSLQHTLYRMAEAALAAVAPAVAGIHLAMPNKHYLPVNLAPFGLGGEEHANEIFLPTDEPHGQIEARVVRNDRDTAAHRHPSKP